MTSDDRTPPGLARRAKPVSRTGKGRSPAPLLIIGAFVLAAVYLASPRVQIAVESFLRPEAARARQGCLDAAQSQPNTPGFTRFLRYGKAHATPQGFYVDDVVIGEMSEGFETELEFTCYIDRKGTIVGTARRAWSRPPPEDPRDDTFPVPGKAH
ncbi:MAG: hypothetical protein U9R74_17690 [Pseudomonadota bacterium]|nr:hypothetical protein [Pseudomonadota bacterium]